MRMPAKNPPCLMLPRVMQSPRRHLRRHPQPPRVQPVDHPRNRLALEIELLQLQIKRRPPPRKRYIVHLKPVKLMPMNRDMPQPRVLPRIPLINSHSYQVRHDVRQPVVVIPLDPHHFNISLGIRQLADVAQKLPVILRQAREVKVGENISQQNQPAKNIFLQHARCLARAACRRTQMQVREDQRAVHGQIHTLFVAAEC
jgi:hypothetical protein